VTFVKLLALKRALTLAPREHLRRAQIFVRTNDTVPASRTAEGAVVGFGTGTRLLPTVYDALKARRRRRRLWRVLSIGVPTLLASVYYGLIASDRYVSDLRWS